MKVIVTYFKFQHKIKWIRLVQYNNRGIIKHNIFIIEKGIIVSNFLKFAKSFLKWVYPQCTNKNWKKKYYQKHDVDIELWRIKYKLIQMYWIWNKSKIQVNASEFSKIKDIQLSLIDNVNVKIK